MKLMRCALSAEVIRRGRDDGTLELTLEELEGRSTNA